MLLKHSLNLVLKGQRRNFSNMKILDIIKNSKAVKSLDEKSKGVFVVDDTLQLAFAVSSSYLKNPRNILIVTPNLYSAQNVYEQISSFINEDDILFYPLDEVIRIDKVSSSKEMISQRLYVMSECLNGKNKILITHVSASLRYLPPKSVYKDHTIELKVGLSYDIKKIIDLLTENGFSRVGKIDQSLQFALRGDILDVFPINSEIPYRIEFFDDEIESIRTFDIASQRSLNEISSINIFPSNELMYEKDNYSSIKEKIIEELNLETKDIKISETRNKLVSKINYDLSRIKDDGFDESLYQYFYYAYENKTTILDYFDSELTILYSFDRLEKAYNFTILELNSYFDELYKNGLSLKNVKYFNDISYLTNREYIKTNPYYQSEEDYSLPIRSIMYSASSLIKSISLLDDYKKENKCILVTMDEKSLEVYEKFLISENVEYFKSENGESYSGKIGLYPFDFKEGFELFEYNVVVLTKKELMGYRSYSNRYIARYKKAEILSSYEDLNPGDYIVHEENGIGQFLNIETIDDINGEPKDYLKLKYRDDDILYIPLEKFFLIRKFVGQEGAVPKLSKLGGNDWKKTKEKIKSKVNDIADRLINLYAIRENTPGFAFEEDDEFQQNFENNFPHALTMDQQKAIMEIKNDMMKSSPMDRLLCGDVGFGKTEVAFRAAFKAILSHKQVMLLCPTTILARQHHELALSRFSPFGVKVALFSRFVSEKKQKEQIELIKEGKIQLIIGTHRLLSKEIKVPDLGLLIVDEEQRFGVEHKERIKELSKNIDVLTLTATPIPRTLQMSLLGIRSLSTLNVAPMNRMPVQTYVVPYQESLVIQVIERELSREGQVFYLHNRVSSIYQKARTIESKIQGAKVGVVHGKMDKEDVDEIMDAYYKGNINILVCTSIIETGLDIPNANTIIIENADLFGLSQLYQIKGRVGRSSRVAYAYLLYNEDKDMSENAIKRLKAIKDFTELGSGYKIAQRDLNIRGAGDILGAEQSGFIDTVGMDLYYKILSEVMNEKKGIKEEKKYVKPLDIYLSGYVPSTYASDSDKIQIYQEIEDINTIASLEIFRRKLRDIYGRLPKEVESLLRKRKIEILASSPYIESVKQEEVVIITLSKEANKVPRLAFNLNEKLFHLSDRIGARLTNGFFVIRLVKGKDLLKDLETILEAIFSVCREN